MRKVKLNDIAKKVGVSISTVSRAINRPEMVKESTRNKILKVVKEMGYKPKVSRRTTLNDIAKAAGVSRATVSRTLNNPKIVKESTRNKVLKVIKKTGYKPKIKEKGLVSRKTTTVKSRSKSRIRIKDIAKASGVSVSTVYRTLNKPDKVSQLTRLRVLKFINELDYKPRVNISKKVLEYKNYMATKPNDTVHKRWGMYTHDARYKDYTASIVKMIMSDMKINTDQAYYMLYYIVSNDLDYERAKRDMMVDPNFEIYRDKSRKRR